MIHQPSLEGRGALNSSTSERLCPGRVGSGCQSKPLGQTLQGQVGGLWAGHRKTCKIRLHLMGSCTGFIPRTAPTRQKPRELFGRQKRGMSGYVTNTTKVASAWDSVRPLISAGPCQQGLEANVLWGQLGKLPLTCATAHSTRKNHPSFSIQTFLFTNTGE